MRYAIIDEETNEVLVGCRKRLSAEDIVGQLPNHKVVKGEVLITMVPGNRKAFFESAETGEQWEIPIPRYLRGMD